VRDNLEGGSTSGLPASGAGGSSDTSSSTVFNALPSPPILSGRSNTSTLQLGDVIASSNCEPGADQREFAGYLRLDQVDGSVSSLWQASMSQAISVHFRPTEPEKVPKVLEMLGQTAALIARKQGKSVAEQ